MSPEESDLYGGLAGGSLPIEQLELGGGITISRTYAHLMAPFLMAFHPPVNGLHPAPWRPASGGLGWDILGQIHVPKDFKIEGWWDRINIVWWVIALLRFRASPFLTVPVVANGPFADGVSVEGIQYWPVEIENRMVWVEKEHSREIREADLLWIKEHWLDATNLVKAKTEFYLLFNACAQCGFTRNPALAMLSLWGALEGIFSPAKVELRFRISSNIAAFLEHSGERRLALQKEVAKLYDARSSAAHGSSEDQAEALVETYALSKRLIIKMIETRHVPSREDLEKALFCG